MVPETRADADGQLGCLAKTLAKLGIENILDKASVLGVEASKPVLVGGGTDVNVSDHGNEGEIAEISTLDLLGVVLCP